MGPVSTLVAIFVLVCGSIFCFNDIRLIKKETRELALHGVRVEADIIQLRGKVNKVSGIARNYSAKVEFLTEDGQPVVTPVAVSDEIGDAIQYGASKTLTVVYSRETPNLARVAGVVPSIKAQLIFGLLCALFAVLAAWMFIKADYDTPEPVN